MPANVLNYVDQTGSNGDNAYNFNGSVYSNKVVLSALVTATLAEINAGKVLIPAVSGKVITVVDYKASVLGNFATTTAVLVQDSAAGTVIATNAVAALTTGNILNEKTTNVTMGAGYLTLLTAGRGVSVANSGSAATGGTSITFRILYIIS